MQLTLDLKSSLPDGSFQQNLEAGTLSKGGVALSDGHMIYEYRVDAIICGQGYLFLPFSELQPFPEILCSVYLSLFCYVFALNVSNLFDNIIVML